MCCDHSNLQAGERTLGRELTLLVWWVQAGCLDMVAVLLDSEGFSPTGAPPKGTFLLPSISSLKLKDFAYVCQFSKKHYLFILPMLQKSKGE